MHNPPPFRLSSPWRAPSLVDAAHPQRAEVEAFISAVYAQRFGAHLTHFLPHLLAFRDGDGGLVAAVGLRCASEGALFSEQYLDAPAEAVVAHTLGRKVERRHVVEVGNFAARGSGDARRVIEHVTGLLHRAGLRWVVLVATRQLRNAFDRLHLATAVLADACQQRLADDGTDWGRYYDAQPQVLCGDLAAGQAFLMMTQADREATETPSMAQSTCLAVMS